MLCDVSMEPPSHFFQEFQMLRLCCKEPGPSEAPYLPVLCRLIRMLHAGVYKALCRAAGSHASAARWRPAPGCSAGGQSKVCDGAPGCYPQVGPFPPQEWHTRAGEHARRGTGHEGWSSPQVLNPGSMCPWKLWDAGCCLGVPASPSEHIQSVGTLKALKFLSSQGITSSFTK